MQFTFSRKVTSGGKPLHGAFLRAFRLTWLLSLWIVATILHSILRHLLFQRLATTLLVSLSGSQTRRSRSSLGSSNHITATFLDYKYISFCRSRRVLRPTPSKILLYAYALPVLFCFCFFVFLVEANRQDLFFFISCFLQFCAFCPKLPHIHVQIHCHANEKR